MGIPSPQKPPPKLLDQVAAKMRMLHYSIRTEEAYLDWIRRFILFHHKQHPRDMGATEIEAFLTDLAVNGKVAASTQNQAFSALLFLYRNVLEVKLPALNALRAQRPDRVPVVLTVEEVRLVLAEIDGIELLQAEILYGTGLRVLECCRLRVQDIDFGRKLIVVRDGKGEKDRLVPLPARTEARLHDQIAQVGRIHERDLGHADVSTTMIYTHVLQRGARGVQSPLDRL